MTEEELDVLIDYMEEVYRYDYSLSEEDVRVIITALNYYKRNRPYKELL